jgi:hypothetical protein
MDGVSAQYTLQNELCSWKELVQLFCMYSHCIIQKIMWGLISQAWRDRRIELQKFSYTNHMVALHAFLLSYMVSVLWVLWQFTLMTLKPMFPCKAVRDFQGVCPSLDSASSNFSTVITQCFSLGFAFSNDPVYLNLCTALWIVSHCGTVRFWHLCHNLLLFLQNNFSYRYLTRTVIVPMCISHGYHTGQVQQHKVKQNGARR